MNRKSINLTQKQIENRALIVTTVVNAIITGAGIWMYFLTDLQMMFLDGFFSLIGLLSALAAVLISKVRNFKLKLSRSTDEFLKAHQKEFMPEDTKAGQIIDYLERYSGNTVCSKQLYREALGHDYDEPKQWELREINDIMNNAVTGWKAFANPRYFPEPYRRQRGWERIPIDNEPDNNTGKFHELTEAEMQQLELPKEWLE